MDTLIVLVVLVVLIVGGFLLINRMRSSPTADRAGRVLRSKLDDVQEQQRREPTMESLQPGDAIAFGDGGNALVMSVLACREETGPRTSLWRWSFLDDGKLLDAAPDGNVLYNQSEIAYQGREKFQSLVADAAQGGILKTFEARVRAGTMASNPVTFEHLGLTFHVGSTGSFVGTHTGKPLTEVWRDLSPQSGDNVYFKAEAQTGEQLLGVWTSHIVLLVGQKLGLTDVDAIYAGTEGDT